MDGCQKIDTTIKRMKELGMNKFAVTNHGNVINMPYLIEKGAKEGVQVIPGCEFYICWDFPAHLKDEDHKKTYHMVVLAMNQIGYKNLLQLASKGYLVGKYYKPRIDKAMLEQHSEGLIILTACLNGTLANQLGKQDKCPIDLIEDVNWLKEVFRDRVYLEIQRHPNMPENDKATEGIIELSKIHNLPLVATCDAHYAYKEHFDAWQSLMLLQTNFRFGNELENDYYIKSKQEMLSLFNDYPEAVYESGKIAERCEPIVFDKSIKYPPFDTKGMPSGDFLKQLAYEGLDKKIKEGKISLAKRKEYEERLEYECRILAEKNFATYILIVADFIAWAKDNEISVGPGRGSGAGSLVTYLTRITEVDPIEYGLIFERFINPERDSFPDIDTDFHDEDRVKVIEYVTKKYGEDHVCSILTIVGLAAKGAVREICRRYGVSPTDTNAFSKLIPGAVRGRNISLIDAPKEEPKLAEKLNDPLYKKIFEVALVIENMAKSTGSHAAGIIISDDKPLTDHIGQMVDKNGKITSSDDMKVLEMLGFIKMDFLGLKTLTIIDNTLKRIKANHGISIDLNSINMYDSAVYANILCAGKLAGVFQLSGSSGFKNVTMNMKPQSIEGISDINAIYRPGPLDNGFVDKYVENVEKVSKSQPIIYMMQVDNPEKQKEIEIILKPTFGVCLYQEQIQFIAQKVAGYTLGGADLLRRAIGKKKPEEMEIQKKVFVDGCVKNNISKQSAEELFTQIEKFADYCLSYDTEVLTLEFGWTKIGELVENRIAANVISVNEKGLLYSQPIKQYWNKGIKEVFIYILENGEEIKCTPDHKFLTTKMEMKSIDEIFQNNEELYYVNQERLDPLIK